VIDLAQQSTKDLEAQGYVARNVKIIKNILNRCLNADRVALGKLNVNFQSVSIESMLSDLRAQHSADKHRIEIQISPEIKTISTDYQCLEIILNNLLDNALRYGDDAQPIQVSVAKASSSEGVNGICLTVSNKIGIASWPDPDRVFQKYYRSPGALAISGTGLGLFLVASMANILGGSCSYAPDDTHVRFELWLPI
jgi:K+-sensing histidine kinase KdpD